MGMTEQTAYMLAIAIAWLAFGAACAGTWWSVRQEGLPRLPFALLFGLHGIVAIVVAIALMLQIYDREACAERTVQGLMKHTTYIQWGETR